MSKKTVSLAALIAFTLVSFFGCADISQRRSEETVDPDDTQLTEPTVDTTTEEISVPLEVKDFGGYVFNVLSFKKTTPGTHLQHLDFGWSDENTGDLINDAVYKRNLIVEERYNVTIKNHQTDDPYTTGQKAILAGLDDYDIILPYIDKSFKLAAENLLMDFYTLPGLDIDRAWWDAAIKRDLSLGGKLYVLTGDISMSDEELNYAVYFNKDLIEKYKLDDCYQLVRDNKWNLDTMHSMAKAVTLDLNGDTLLNGEDQFGLLTDYSVAPVWFFSAGGQMAGLKDDGSPQLMMGDAHTVEIMTKLSELFRDKEAVLNASDTTASWTGFDNMLITNRALFRAGSIYDIPFYRDMASDFGILPYPKLDADQDDYHHIIATSVCTGVCVPQTASDPARTGLLLDALASESKDTVTKAYYDINLYKKLARDNESGEMLDIIFASKRYDLAKAFGWGGLEDVIRNSVKNGQNFTSLYAAAKTKAETEMAKSYEVFK